MSKKKGQRHEVLQILHKLYLIQDELYHTMPKGTVDFTKLYYLQNQLQNFLNKTL